MHLNASVLHEIPEPSDIQGLLQHFINVKNRVPSSVGSGVRDNTLPDIAIIASYLYKSKSQHHHHQSTFERQEFIASNLKGVAVTLTADSRSLWRQLSLLRSVTIGTCNSNVSKEEFYTAQHKTFTLDMKMNDGYSVMKTFLIGYTNK
ncbi:hypothetical protein TNCV_1653071 [Trichonephila clavipes]|nr:hypothetical protein TNCV_1653071 [Trichonephila clavipes]